MLHGRQMDIVFQPHDGSASICAEFLRVLVLLCAFAAGALVLFGDNVLIIGLCVVIGSLLIVLCDAWRLPERRTEKEHGNSPYPIGRH